MKIETPILRRTGPVPFWRGEEKCLATLERLYTRAADRAAALLGLHDSSATRTCPCAEKAGFGIIRGRKGGATCQTE
jgi:hypothetical protein